MARAPEEHQPGAVCTILGGPNGSGKSSLYQALAPPGEFDNADVVARRLNPHDPEGAALPASRAVLRRLDELLSQRADFVWETTLSSNQARALIHRACATGYEVGLVFVALASADLTVDRVAQRVSQGGHYIAEDVVRRRSDTAFEKLARAIPFAHGRRSSTTRSASPPCCCASSRPLSKRIVSTRRSPITLGSAQP